LRRTARVLSSQRAVGTGDRLCRRPPLRRFRSRACEPGAGDGIQRSQADLRVGMLDRLSRRPFITAVLALAAIPARAAEPPKVVATFSVLGDMISRIGGDKVRLTTIVGGDGDCELYA